MSGRFCKCWGQTLKTLSALSTVCVFFCSGKNQNKPGTAAELQHNLETNREMESVHKERWKLESDVSLMVTLETSESQENHRCCLYL